MSHQPYENWLFSDDPLDPEQKPLLDEHLHKCLSCSQLAVGWNQASNLLQTATLVTPIPGFQERWRATLQAKQAQKQRRQSWMVFWLVILLAIIVFGLFIAVFFSSHPSPMEVVSDLLHSIVAPIKLTRSLVNLSYSLAKFFPPIYAIFLGAFFAINMSLLISIWFAMIWKLTLPLGVRK